MEYLQPIQIDQKYNFEYSYQKCDNIKKNGQNALNLDNLLNNNKEITRLNNKKYIIVKDDNKIIQTEKLNLCYREEDMIKIEFQIKVNEISIEQFLFNYVNNNDIEKTQWIKNNERYTSKNKQYFDQFKLKLIQQLNGKIKEDIDYSIQIQDYLVNAFDLLDKNLDGQKFQQYILPIFFQLAAKIILLKQEKECY
ncbi:hypothetical protein PPERSA_11380 [Pseudocohnilembus persalinus]|uniref:Uncharacterized protein n=1 Tax=Pseudocohnilembus persalinus TaxID=266149 RepID=A0A0V0QQF4_PSEPJ|nr:hypothetical protein PPERSA_11380 [Pseudocohnilembus persalinus]|eukprot:KRX04256.1 hypothetical protein PPERSA_11380 [Pseudocohnilembus persalinus]